MLITGHIFRTAHPDESAEERRELERMVAEAAAGKSKHREMRAEARAAERAKLEKERANAREKIYAPPGTKAGSAKTGKLA